MKMAGVHTPFMPQEYSVNPFSLLKEIQNGNLVATLGVSKNVEGMDVIVLEDCNVEIACNISSGLVNRKNEPYSLGDIVLMLITPKEQYNYALVSSRKGRKYLNVLERPKILSTLSSHGPSEIPTTSTHGPTATSTVHQLPLDLTLRRSSAYPHDAQRPVHLPKEALWIVKHHHNELLEDDSEEEEALASLPYTATSDIQRVDKLQSTQGLFKAYSASFNDEETSRQLQATLIYTALKKNEYSIAPHYSLAASRGGLNLQKVLANVEEVDRAIRKRENPSRFSHLKEVSFNAQVMNKLKRSRTKRSSPEADIHTGPKASVPSYADASKSGKSISNKTPYCVYDMCLKNHTYPIILIPSSGNVLINRYNVVDILQNEKFVTPSEGKANNMANTEASTLPFNAIIIEHILKDKRCKFRIVESRYTSRFEKKDWDAVVAVVIHGGRWQFDGWPFRDFTDLFLTIKGFLILYNNDPLPQDAHNWHIKVLRISRSHRYNDAAVSREFWQVLDEFLLNTKTHSANMETKLNARSLR